MFTLLTETADLETVISYFCGMVVVYRFYLCIEYEQGRGMGEAVIMREWSPEMQFEFHSNMRLILSNSDANLLRIVSQVSYLYLKGYNLQFI